MKKFFSWFKNSTRIKRWILLIVCGILLTCYAFARIFTTEADITFTAITDIVLMFVVGFVCIILGIIFIQKRTLELIIEANDEHKELGERGDVKIKSLIFNKRVYENGPKVLVIGGGKGLNTIVEGLKKYTNNITSIVTMSDYGIDPSQSRRELGILPFNDIKNSIIAMSDHQELMSKLMNLEFKNNRLKNLNFGDIYLTAMNEIYDNVPDAIRKSTEVLNITGRVIPVTLDEIKIVAEFTDGTKIEKKDNIEQVVTQKVERINRISISPNNVTPAPGVLEAIAEAEAIIIGPGSLYTNVIPNLLVKGVVKAIKESKAIKVYVSNIMTEPGQTDGFRLSDHIKAIQDHVGLDVFNTVIADNGEIVPEFIRKANSRGSDVVEVDKLKVGSMGVKVIERNMSSIKNGEIRHDPNEIAATIIGLICDELKYNDKQYETEYLLLNSVLKEQNRRQAKADKAKKKLQKKYAKKGIKPDQIAEIEKRNKKQSKFAEKYTDRVKTIRTTDKLAEERKRKVEQAIKMKKSKMKK